MTELGIVRRNIVRADRAATDALAKYGVATVHEAMGRVGLMKPYMRPIYAGAQRLGHGGHRAAASRRQLDDACRRRADQPGDIVVAAITAECTDGYFGDLLATSFKARGARALDHRRGRARREDADRDGLSRSGANASAPRAR